VELDVKCYLAFERAIKKMANMKSVIAIAMGVVIILADIAWLIIDGSYTYTPWLVLGIVILLASLIWLAMDFSLMRDAQKSPSASKTATDINQK
jgi:hypothetical protein